MNRLLSRARGRWTLWVARPFAAVAWLAREAVSRRKTYAVWWSSDEQVFVGEIRARSLDEAAGICIPRGYVLLGRVRFKIDHCPLAEWLAG